jgi:hypothetical protein
MRGNTSRRSEITSAFIGSRELIARMGAAARDPKRAWLPVAWLSFYRTLELRVPKAPFGELQTPAELRKDWSDGLACR